MFDIVIIGAGISGINTAYRVQTQLPGLQYTILEARGALGGTWDLFRYPGIRSDSDLYTFGFPWQPWAANNAIADAASIKKYMVETAAKHGIDQHIQFYKKLIAADWSSEKHLWSLHVETNGVKEILHARFLVLGSGYYNYHTPLETKITGIENFTGTVVHPQFWPPDLDYQDKTMVVIGSGATAVTLLPALIEKASFVTMLQRSPSYVLTRPTSDALEKIAQNLLPDRIGRKLIRWKNILVSFLLFQWCRAFPEAAKRLLRNATIKELPPSIPCDPHFKPAYNPWEQRMCICPDGDFWAALRSGKTNIVTGNIKTMKENIIIMEDGTKVEADIIVTATGLKFQLAGGATISVDGMAINPRDKFIWKGAMLQDVPNAAFVIGYANASWTLGADATARLFCRIVKNMERKQMTAVVPIVGKGEKLGVRPILNLTSTYVKAASETMPKAGDSGPWKPRSNYFLDWWYAIFGDIKEGLVYEK